MRSVGYKSVYFLLISSSLAFPCGKGLGEVRLGDKIVSIEIKESKNKSKWIADDDGMLTVSFVAAYCNNSIPYLKVDFTEDQRTCIDSFQDKNNISYGDRISLYANKEGNENKKALNDKLKQICGVDIIGTINKEEEKRNSLPVSCVDEVKNIISKASKRSEEYLKEQSEPKNLDKLNATEAQKQDFVKKLKEDVEVAKEANKTFSKSPVTIGEFEKWAKGLSKVIKNHAYQV